MYIVYISVWMLKKQEKKFKKSLEKVKKIENFQKKWWKKKSRKENKMIEREKRKRGSEIRKREFLVSRRNRKQEKLGQKECLNKDLAQCAIFTTNSLKFTLFHP